MNPVIPIAFKTLCILTAPDSIPFMSVELEDGLDIGTIYEAEKVSLGDIYLITNYIEATNGASRRTFVTYKDYPIDIIDAGSEAMEGFLDNFYITDPRGDTITGWFTVSDAAPVVTDAPEGGYNIEFTDRISLIVINHDSSDQENYVLRDNQVIYKIDEDGAFSLTSIRPKPDDIASATRMLHIYDIEIDTENPLSSGEMAQKLRQLLPIPGRVTTTISH